MISTPAIDRSSIDAMLAHMKEVSARTHTVVAGSIVEASQAPSFGEVFRSSLEKVSALQDHSDRLAQAFARGDDSVSVSDMMISSQKANIAFQATVQVRNKLVSAYHDLMAMSV